MQWGQLLPKGTNLIQYDIFTHPPIPLRPLAPFLIIFLFINIVSYFEGFLFWKFSGLELSEPF